MNIKILTAEISSYIIKHRRYLHEHPECSNEEDSTIQYLTQELSALGIRHIMIPHGGILGFIEGDAAGRTVLLRADCDALPIKEDTDNLRRRRTCCSKNDGVMHACGHDGHMAMLLGAARILNENVEELKGKVILMFERGEEKTSNLVCLLKYIDDHNIHTDSSWGIHLYAGLESGKIAINDGPVMAGNLSFQVTIKGCAGHGSRPDQAKSPVDCFVAIYNAMNTIRMRNISPYETLTFSIGELRGGHQDNVIPESITFSGMVRIFERKTGLAFKEAFVRVIQNICKAYECEAVFDNLSGPTLSVKNNVSCARMAREAVGHVIGDEKVVSAEPWMASESMSLTISLFPGVFALLGIQNLEKGTGAPHHNAQFDIDEDVLIYGTAATVAYACNFLENNIDTSSHCFQGNLVDLFTEAGRLGSPIQILKNEVSAEEIYG